MPFSLNLPQNVILLWHICKGDIELIPSNIRLRKRNTLLIVRGSYFKEVQLTGLKMAGNRGEHFYWMRKAGCGDVKEQFLTPSLEAGLALPLSAFPWLSVLAGW